MDLNGKAVARFDVRTAAGALTLVFEATIDGKVLTVDEGCSGAAEKANRVSDFFRRAIAIHGNRVVIVCSDGNAMYKFCHLCINGTRCDSV